MRTFAPAAVTVTVLLWLSAGTPLAAQPAVSVRLTQIRASNSGEPGVDPALGRLGNELKRTYPYRSFRRISSGSQTVSETGAGFPLANGMTLSVKLVGSDREMIKLRLALLERSREVNAFTVNVHNGGTFLTGVPWEEDLLVLAICPRLSEERDR